MYSKTINRQVNYIHKTLIFLLLFFMFISLSCTKEPSSDLNDGLTLYRQNKLEDARPYFERAVQQEKNNPDAYAWLAETYRRLGQIDTAIVTAQKAIAIDSCHSFAHTTLAYAYNPMYSSRAGTENDSVWSHLLKAAACDSTDGNVWLAIWTQAIWRKNYDLEKKSLHFLIETGFLTPAILAFNRWMLRHVPENAILLTNGDMDTYPAVALQEVENYRPDVAIVNYSLLNTAWYARFLRDKYGIQLPFTDSELDALKAYQEKDGSPKKPAGRIMEGWLKKKMAGDFDRPIAISTTVSDLSFARDTKDHLILAGAFKLWLPKPADSPLDTSMIRASLASVQPDNFSGPFVSVNDHSAVRIASTNRLAMNITRLALTYSETLIETDRNSEAYEMLVWAEQFEKKTEIGPVFSEKIEQLKVKSLHETK